MNPMPNIPLMTSFFSVAICKPHRTGNGNITVATSMNKLNVPMNKSKLFWSPQTPPGILGSQLKEMGRQMRQTVRTVETK